MHEQVRQLLQNECAAYRERFNREQMWPIVDLHRQSTELSMAERAWIAAIDSSPGRDLLVPLPHVLEQIQHPLGLIGFVAQHNHASTSTAALLELHPWQVTTDGVGKSAVGLQLLGVAIPWHEIPRPATREDASAAAAASEQLVDRFVRLDAETAHCRIVASDMPFVGMKDGALHVVAPLGEPFLALWDMARSVSRRMGRHYRSGLGNVSWLRGFVERLAQSYYLNYGEGGAFASCAAAYRLDHVFFLAKAAPGEITSPVKVDLDAVAGAELITGQLKLNPAYHASMFWRIDVSEHLRRLSLIQAELESWPTASLLKISSQPQPAEIEALASTIRSHLETACLTV